MQIVTDSSHDLTPEQMAGLDIHVVPLTINLDGRSYKSGVDIESDEFYRLMVEAGTFPTTSLPSAGDFAALYQRLATEDPDILSIHISSGLSGTLNAARAGAEMAAEAKVTFVDTKTLSAGVGWQVEAAARAAKAGWVKEETLPLLQRIGEATDVLCILDEVKYLVHGGRISHLRGLVASVLHIRPVIGVDKSSGTFVAAGQARSFGKALDAAVNVALRQHGEGAALRVQVAGTALPEGIEMLRERLASRFQCHWLPETRLGPVLGAHAGPHVVGFGYAPQSVFDDLPWE